MARAAAKRNRSAGKAARQVAEPKRARRKAEKTLEDELFFTRLRGHAKWAFALLAVVFAGSFVFLGVGSGNAGLGDVFSNVFTGGSAPSIEELQEKLAKTPRDKAVLTDLAQALERDGRYTEAVARYQTANRDALGVYKQLSGLSPQDSGALLRWAQAAEGAGEVNTALTVYKRFVNRFPTDPLVVDARQRIKELEAQKIAQQATGGAEG